MYDIIVVGAGPAGLTAAIYARRAEKTVLVIERESFGGQITHSPRVENYPGFAVMSGVEFADKLIGQTLGLGAEIEMDTVTDVKGTPGDYTVFCRDNQYKAKSVIIAAGSAHRTLGLEREADFTGEGISYCAVCDGAFYKGKTVAVVGGGNSALQEAVMLSDICKKVFVVQNMDFLTGEVRLRNDLETRENVEIVLSSTVIKILGDDRFEGIVINTKGEEKKLPVDGVFVAIGQKPENEPFVNVAARNDSGYILSDETCVPEGSKDGIFVAGDCRTKAVRQITTATGDGAVAAISACKFVDSLR